MPRTPKNINRKNEDNFFKKVNKTRGCWYWTACKNPNRYGQFGINYYVYPAHRVSWVIHNGQFPDSLYVLHTCDNPSCVNPKHLWLGTHQDNSTDMVKKGRCQNGQAHYKAKLSNKDIKYIRKIYSKSNVKQIELAKKFNIDQASISKIINFKCWKHL